MDDYLPCEYCNGSGGHGMHDGRKIHCMSCQGTGLSHKELSHPQDDYRDDFQSQALGHLVPSREQIEDSLFEQMRNKRWDDFVDFSASAVGEPIIGHTVGSNQRPTFAFTPFAGAGMKMKNPAAEIFRRGNPMEIAWRILKSPEGPWYHGTSRLNTALQEGLQPKGNIRYPDNMRPPSPGLYFTTDPNEARSFATQSKSKPNERPGVVMVRNIDGVPVKMHGGHQHIIARKPILRDRFEEVQDDGN